MTPYIAFILSLCLSSSSLYLMSKYFKLYSITHIRVTHALYFFHITMQFIPAVFFCFYPEKYAVAPLYLLACSIAALGIPLGSLLSCWLMQRPIHNVFEVSDDIDIIRRSKHFTLGWAIFGAAIIISFLIQAPPSPLYALIAKQDGFLNIQMNREIILNMGYIYGLARVFILPILALFLLLQWKNTHSYLGKFLIITLITFIGLYAAYPSSKTPVAMLLLLIIMLGFTYNQNSLNSFQAIRSKLPLFILLSAAILLYPIFIFSMKAFGQANDIFTVIIDGVLSRIFYNPAANAYFAFQIIPDIFPFTHFRDIGKLTQLMNWEPYPLAQRIALSRHYFLSQSPPPSIGGFYAQWGWPLVIAGPIIAAAIFKSVETLVLSVKKLSPIELALYTLLLYGAFRFSWARFHNILLTECIIPVLVVWTLWQFYKHIPQTKAKKIHA